MRTNEHDDSGTGRTRSGTGRNDKRNKEIKKQRRIMDINIPKDTKTVTLHLPEFDTQQSARLCDVLPAIEGPVELVITEAVITQPDAKYAPGLRKMGANGNEIHNYLVNTRLLDGASLLVLPVAHISTEVVDKCLYANLAIAERQAFTRILVKVPRVHEED